MEPAGGLQGAIAMLVTAFDENGAVDHTSMERQAAYVLDQGADAIALFGLAGEGAKLSDREKDYIVRAVCAVVQGRRPVIAAADRAGTQIAISLGTRLVTAGATHLMAMPLTAGSAVEHFSALARATAAPVIVQDAPAASHVELSVDDLRALGDEVEALCGVKVEVPQTLAKLTRLRKRVPGMQLFGGRGGTAFLAELQAGAAGTMVGPAVIAAFASVWQHWRHHDFEQARAAMNRLLPLCALTEGNDSYAQAQKELLASQGVLTSTMMRHPSSPAPEWLREEWLRTYADPGGPIAQADGMVR